MPLRNNTHAQSCCQLKEKVHTLQFNLRCPYILCGSQEGNNFIHAKRCTSIPVHPRVQYYGGPVVFCFALQGHCTINSAHCCRSTFFSQSLSSLNPDKALCSSHYGQHLAGETLITPEINSRDIIASVRQYIHQNPSSYVVLVICNIINNRSGYPLTVRMCVTAIFHFSVKATK